MDVEHRMTPEEWARHVQEHRAMEAAGYGFEPTPTEIAVARRVRAEIEADNQRTGRISLALFAAFAAGLWLAGCVAGAA